MGEPSRKVTVVKAIVTVMLVTAVVASVVGAVAYAASRALVGMLS